MRVADQQWPLLVDLSYISDGHHPIDTKRNEVVREFLLQRIDEILGDNGAEYKHVEQRVGESKNSTKYTTTKKPKAVTIFDDRLSNVTFVDDFRKQPWTCYSESTNIVVYIRGKDDPEDDWWTSENKYEGPGGVLVNAHFDSVSSGFGATDDGVGVVTILQLLSYYTREGKQPKRGLVLLLNSTSPCHNPCRLW